MRQTDRHLRGRIRAITGVGIAGLTLYVIASFLPESPLWGFNHLAFLSPFRRIGFFIAIGLILIPAVNRKISSLLTGVIRDLDRKSLKGLVVASSFVLCAVLCFYFFSIETDMYGDTRSIVLHESSYTIGDVFDLTKPEPVSRLVPQAVGSVLGITPVESYRFVSYVSGVFYLLILISLVRSIDRTGLLKMIVLLVGLSGGFLFLFLGHVEHYTLLFLAVSFYLFLAWQLFRGRDVLGWMIAVFIIGTRVHVEMVLLLPGLIYAVVHRMGEKKLIHGRWTGVKVVSAAVGVSVVVAILFYVFFFRAHSLSPDDPGYRIFLPVVNTVPLMNHYTLQSWAHLSDVVQILGLLISPVVIYLFLIPFLSGGRVRYDSPGTLFFLISSFYCLLFVFTLHPYLSMPRDWDMYAVVAAPVMFAGISFIADNMGNKHAELLCRAALPWIFVLAVLSNSIILVNSEPQAVRKRVRSIGVWVFRSYHGDSSFLINVGCKRIPDLNEEISERERIITVLEPFVQPNDMEFSFLEQKLAEAYYLNGQLSESINHYGLSLKAADNSEALKGLGVVLLKSRNIDDGIQTLDVYNHRYNEPEVTDHHMLVAAQYGQYLKFLTESGADDSEIQDVLDSFEVVPSQAEDAN